MNLVPVAFPWAKKNKTAGVFMGLVLLSLAVVILRMENRGNLAYDGVPIPFAQEANGLQGAVSFFGNRSGVDIYQVTYNTTEKKERLLIDRIYLITVPTRTGVRSVALDAVMNSVVTPSSHAVKFFGYEYSDATASVEKANRNAATFAARFPGKFFASPLARLADGSTLASYETANGITFRKTDGSAGSVLLEPGKFYVMVVNEEAGADLWVEPLSCGNGTVEGGEACDDGNQVDTDLCKNDCTSDLPVPFDATLHGAASSSSSASAGTSASASTSASAGTSTSASTGTSTSAGTSTSPGTSNSATTSSSSSTHVDTSAGSSTSASAGTSTSASTGTSASAGTSNSATTSSSSSTHVDTSASASSTTSSSVSTSSSVASSIPFQGEQLTVAMVASTDNSLVIPGVLNTPALTMNITAHDEDVQINRLVFADAQGTFAPGFLHMDRDSNGDGTLDMSMGTAAQKISTGAFDPDTNTFTYYANSVFGFQPGELVIPANTTQKFVLALNVSLPLPATGIQMGFDTHQIGYITASTDDGPLERISVDGQCTHDCEIALHTAASPILNFREGIAAMGITFQHNAPDRTGNNVIAGGTTGVPLSRFTMEAGPKDVSLDHLRFAVVTPNTQNFTIARDTNNDGITDESVATTATVDNGIATVVFAPPVTIAAGTTTGIYELKGDVAHDPQGYAVTATLLTTFDAVAAHTAEGAVSGLSSCIAPATTWQIGISIPPDGGMEWGVLGDDAVALSIDNRVFDGNGISTGPAQTVLVGGATNIQVSRLSFKSGEYFSYGPDVFLSSLVYTAATADDFTNLENFALLVDTDGDLVAETNLQAQAVVSGTTLTLTFPEYKIPRSTARLIELHADVKDTVDPSKTTYITLDTAQDNFVTAHTTLPLAGIKRNNSCTGTCMIEVMDTTGFGLTFKNHGSLVVSGTNITDANGLYPAPEIQLGGTMSEPVMDLTFTAILEDIRVKGLDITALQGASAVSEIKFFEPDGSTPVATATIADCGSRVVYPSTFCAVLSDTDFIVSTAATRTLRVRPVYKSDAEGGVAGTTTQFQLYDMPESTAPAADGGPVRAVGVQSSESLAMDDARYISGALTPPVGFDGAIGVWDTSPTIGFPDPSVTTGGFTVLMSNLTTVVATLPKPADGTPVPVGNDVTIARYTFTAGTNTNTENGVNKPKIKDLMFFNINLGYTVPVRIINEAHPSVSVTCTRVQPATAYLRCENLQDTLDTSIAPGGSIVLALKSDITPADNVTGFKTVLSTKYNCEQLRVTGSQYYGQLPCVTWIDSDATNSFTVLNNHPVREDIHYTNYGSFINY